MNTYNDNLRSSVVDSLNDQELERKKMEAAMNASKFTLYYAQGATITDAEKLQAAEDDAGKKGKVKKEAVVNSNLSTNVLDSAKQQKSLTDLSVTNMSVSASNVQIATNAVIKLASNVGSITSIISAADYGTDIYQLCTTTKDYMDITAGHAEVISQYSMEASALMSEVSSTHVESQATLADNTVKKMLDIASSEYQAAYDLVTADNAKLSEASVKEKVAEGKLEDSNATYHAAKSAYKLMSQELNLHLRTSDTTFPINTPDEELNMKVKFNALQSPFQESTLIQAQNELLGRKNYAYPVDEYRIFVVKSNKQNIFNIAAAENIYNEDSTQTIKRYVSIEDTNHEKFEVEIPVSTISQIRDTDGEKIEFGQNYVVFLFAKYSEEYKSEINNFENFLSACSYIFTLTEKLDGPEERNIRVIEETEIIVLEEDTDLVIIQENDKVVEAALVERHKWPMELEKKSFTMQFDIDTTANEKQEVEYRCILLPADSDLTRSLLTKKALKLIEEGDEKIQEIFEVYASRILEIESKIEDAEEQLHDATTEEDKKTLIAKIKKLREKLKAAEQALTNRIDEIKQMRNTSSFDGFKQLVEIFDNAVNVDKAKKKIEKELEHYESYKIATKELKQFQKSFATPFTDLANFLDNQEEIKNLKSQVEDHEDEINKLQKEIDEQAKIVADPSSTSEQIKRAEARIEALKETQNNEGTEIKKLQKKISTLEEKGDKLEAKKAEDVESLNEKAKTLDAEFQKYVGSLSFYFDLEISEQVSTANYTLAKPATEVNSNTKQTWEAPIESNTTDNFGNPLVPGDQYIPVILAYSNAPEVDADKFKNRLSNANKTKKFTYEEITVKSDDNE